MAAESGGKRQAPHLKRGGCLQPVFWRRTTDFRIYDEHMTTAAAKSAISAGNPSAAASRMAFQNGETRLFALIPCAGSGSRAGTAGKKQYQGLQGRPMVAHTIEAFRALGVVLAGLYVVTSPGDEQFLQACPEFGADLEHVLPCGGQTRATSVLNGLKAMRAQPGGAGDNDWVLVHDAARCLITPAQIMSLIDACRHDDVGGLLAQPLPDTLKCGAGLRVSATLDRTDKWLAQTPQMFRIGALIAALQTAGASVTDESGAMEAQGLAPRLVAGSAQNFKVTYAEDFALAEAILASRTRMAPVGWT